MQEIPRVIHYCWFGGAPIPEKHRTYMKSWEKYCPDFEIRRWDESNFDVSACPYVREAYRAKKWAFVSDYARFQILYENGGLYFDTDVELLAPLEGIVSAGSFMGLERKNIKNGRRDEVLLGINPGLGMGALPGLPLYREILDLYGTLHFVREDGTLDLTTVVERVTAVMREHGYDGLDRMQSVADITVYPSEYFDPIDCATGARRITDKTLSIHHYAASWADGKMKLKGRLKALLGEKMTREIIGIKRFLQRKKTENEEKKP